MAGTSPMSHPILQLAQAHALLVTGCDKAPTSHKGQVGGRPMPWVLGMGDTVVIAEPWSQLHAVHRRKRGFTALCDRLRALCEMVDQQLKPQELLLQVWADDGDLDEALLEKVARQLNRPIELYTAARLPGVLDAVRAAVTPDHAADQNPLIAVLGWLAGQDGLRPI